MIDKWPCAMVDLETMGPCPDGAILRVGIVPFSLVAGEERVSLRPDWLDVGLSVDLNIKAGAAVSVDQQLWWLEQSPEARAALVEAPMAGDYADLGRRVASYLRSTLFPDNLVLWAKPPQYDLAYLQNLLPAAGCAWPIARRDELCLRTLLRVTKGLGLPGPSRMERGTAHSAAEDAAWQATQAVWLVRELRRLGRT